MTAKKPGAVMGRPPGTKGGGGRKKGSQNKIPKQLKEMILGALDSAGGENYLIAQAKENPTAFLTLIGKVLPTTLAGDPNNPIKTSITVSFE